jgi:hypothetical protein
MVRAYADYLSNGILTMLSDYNYVPDKGECVLAGPETIPEGQCTREGDQFRGSSGFRKIPGDTCVGGLELDKPKMKDCSEGASACRRLCLPAQSGAGKASPGAVSHKRVRRLLFAITEP